MATIPFAIISLPRGIISSISDPTEHPERALPPWDGALCKGAMYETNHQVRRPAAGPGAAVRRVVLESAGLFDILADAGMLVLHSAYIVTRQGEGILFSGPSGIGKSTQAALWQHYGAAQTVNGDRALVRKDFRYLLTELKKMGLLVSVNSNGSLIDRDWLDFFRHEPPFRFNITLYGASDAAYERLCGRPMFARVTENIRALRELGVGVKLNVSMTPYNVADMAEIYRIAQELGTPMQLATYMFPPIRRDEALVGSNDRFTACQAADAADLAAALRAEYDVDEPTALQDAQAFLDALRQLNIV